MENYTITKEQILKLGESIVNDYHLKQWFPEAFKKELEVGKWYKMKGNIHFLCNFNGKIGNNGDSYGFNLVGEWTNDSMCFQNCDTYVEATDEEVEEALIAEAKKKGYKAGTRLVPLLCCSCEIMGEGEDYKYKSKVSDNIGHRLELNGTGIYQDGKWAEIIHEETKVITMEKAEKILSKKYGQKVEIK